MDQFDTWQVVPRQVFTPYSHLLISTVTAFVVISHVGCLRVTGGDTYYGNYEIRKERQEHMYSTVFQSTEMVYLHLYKQKHIQIRVKKIKVEILLDIMALSGPGNI